jgi:FMN reductase
MTTEPALDMRIVVIAGSMRPGNYTGRAVALLIDEFRKQERVSLEVFDPRQMELPIPGTAAASPSALAMTEAVSRASAVVLATPEYHGGFSSVMKLVIENLGFPSVLAGKHVALLGVAAGEIGAIKSLEQLRSVCSHVGAVVLPGPVSVPRVREAFDEDGTCRDPEVEARIRGIVAKVLGYIDGRSCSPGTQEKMTRETDLQTQDD